MKATDGRAPGAGGGGMLDFGRSRSWRTDPSGSVRACLPCSLACAGTMLFRFAEEEDDWDFEGMTLFLEPKKPDTLLARKGWRRRAYLNCRPCGFGNPGR